MRMPAALFFWMASIFPALAYDVAEKDIATLQSDMRAGRVTARMERADGLDEKKIHAAIGA